MKLQIDSLTSTTGWVISSPSTITENEFSEYIAGLNTKSLMIKFDSSGGRVATKTFGTPFDVTNYESLVFSIWSQNKGVDKHYLKPSDFAYKIKLDSTHEYYIPVWSSFSDITIGIEDVTSITQIQITAIHTDIDYIIISEMVAEHEEIPYDILYAVKETIDYMIIQTQGNGILIGTISTTPGDTSITFSARPNFLNRYGVIYIDDGNNSETHQVEDNNADNFRLNDNYDGKEIINTFVNASVYLQFPTYINPKQNDVRLPGMAIWGIEPTPILRGGKLDTLRDSFLVSDSSSKERVEGQILRYPVLVDSESRADELIDIMTRVVRFLIAGEILWINGRKHDLGFTGPPTELRPTQGIDIISKVQYSMDVEVKENINDRQAIPATTTITTTVTPVEQGEI